MNLRVYVAACLTWGGYSGLYNDLDACGCTVDDLIPCGAGVDCQPGHVCRCPERLNPGEAFIVGPDRCETCHETPGSEPQA